MTIHSMTGFANAVGECGGKRINVEIRAVNHRYLDVQFKMPDDLRYLESVLREQVVQYAARGKVECKIQIQPSEKNEAILNINEGLVGELAALNEQWLQKYASLGKLTVADILGFQGVLVSQVEDEEQFEKTVQQLLGQGLKDFADTRRREGLKLEEHIEFRLDKMLEIIEALSELFPSLLQAYMEKTRARLAEAVENIEEDRLKQEFALYLQKSDVDEEFSRLRTHIAEVRRIVTEQKGSVGKRLDFLMQELNREANTLGSKAIAAECTQASVELKVLIEQMREQVQNIE